MLNLDPRSIEHAFKIDVANATTRSATSLPAQRALEAVQRQAIS